MPPITGAVEDEEPAIEIFDFSSVVRSGLHTHLVPSNRAISPADEQPTLPIVADCGRGGWANAEAPETSMRASAAEILVEGLRGIGPYTSVVAM
jgi:hypothetical protein